MVSSLRRDKAIGAMLGMAIGNAHGAASAARKDPLAPYADLPRGHWTSITASVYALGHSLIQLGGFRPKDVLSRWAELETSGAYCCAGHHLDLDRPTRLAANAWKEQKAVFPDLDDQISGAQALTRTLATTLFAGGDQKLSAYLAAEQCRLTHPHPSIVEGCVATANLLEVLLAQDRKVDLIQFEGGHHASNGKPAAGSALDRAIRLVADADSFESVIVYSCGEPDTVLFAALTGMIAGAVHGEASIGGSLLNSLPWKAHLEGLAISLSETVSGFEQQQTEVSGIIEVAR